LGGFRLILVVLTVWGSVTRTVPVPCGDLPTAVRLPTAGNRWRLPSPTPSTAVTDLADAAALPDGGPTDDERVATIRAVGHPNVTATHASTLEVTTDDFLTPAGDCIVGIEADRAPADLDPDFVAACRDPDATIVANLAVGEPGSDAVGDDPAHTAHITGAGHSDLTFASERGAVCRTSDHVDDRTVLVDADRAAVDMDRGLVDALATGAPVRMVLRVAN
jgi:hypothetical protein